MQQGFNLEGLLRTMLPQITDTIGWIIFLTIVVLIARWLAKYADPAEVQTWRKGASWTYLIMVAVLLISLVWYGVSLATSNRFPRSDVTKDSGVYQQMDSHHR